MTGEIAEAVSGGSYPAVRGHARRRGRPTKGAAASLGHKIVDIAFCQFLNAGFSATSMDSVAAEAGISKRTLYDRFPSKMHLLNEALQRRGTLEPEGLREFDARNDPFDAILLDVARWLKDKVLVDDTIALYRLLASEAHRTPELAQFTEEKFLRPVVVELTDIFRHAVDRGQIVDLPVEFLANQFIQAVCGQHVRERVCGVAREQTHATMDEWIENAVRLFLNGAQVTPERAAPRKS
ncbi:TetR/AcrR family transcriptional regulator [Aureimonas flava]|uniref:TetR/AcrR family transcriptional regulator n=1 Tax=Aureimonas flava TaxID=2320271 RepID=UPI00145A0048|nr:TetR/AcrR family transcriptional regulator [Aureimonas flava]